MKDASNALHFLVLGEKCVFGAALNLSSLVCVESRRLSGREFQVIGLTAENVTGGGNIGEC